MMSERDLTANELLATLQKVDEGLTFTEAKNFILEEGAENVENRLKGLKHWKGWNIEKERRLGIYKKYISFRCTPQMQLLLDAMAAQAEVSRSTILQILIMEGAEKRLIQLEDSEVKQ
jgi:hypothetical protein